MLVFPSDLKTHFTARHFERSREISPNDAAYFWEVPRRCSERLALGFEIAYCLYNHD
jgi:hypothetical protein